MLCLVTPKVGLVFDASKMARQVTSMKDARVSQPIAQSSLASAAEDRLQLCPAVESLLFSASPSSGVDGRNPLVVSMRKHYPRLLAAFSMRGKHLWRLGQADTHSGT